MSTVIAGFVLRSTNKLQTIRFYEALGLTTQKHEHDGPVHYEIKPLSDDFVVEVYTKSDVFPEDAVMLSVDSIKDVLYALQVAGFCVRIKAGVRDSVNMKLIYVFDPDDRPVLLLEKK